MFRLLLTALVILVSMGGAHAKLAGCYQRIYTDAELKRHPDMKVAAIQLQFGKLAGDPKSSGQVAGKFRGEKDWSGSIIYCVDTGASTICHVEGDGGQFSVTEFPKQIEVSAANFNFDDEHSVGGKDEHEFHLYPVSASACK